MLRNKLAMTVMGVATISLVVGGGAGYWFAHQENTIHLETCHIHIK